MPDSWPSMRSMARYVLPVLVGPSTAVRRPAALESDIDPTFARARGRSKAIPPPPFAPPPPRGGGGRGGLAPDPPPPPVSTDHPGRWLGARPSRRGPAARCPAARPPP